MSAMVVENEAKVIPPAGIGVPLADKKIPVCERRLRSGEPLAITLAELDVSKFKEMLLQSNGDIWDDAYHARENVKLTRPAHDAWGIKKVMFTFCDDYLQKVIDLPFSQSQDWRVHLAPIYKSIGVDERRIVRSLLACMPPGVEIPVHHDTGFWVQHTHRIHVPIITGPGVDFFVGADKESIQKYEFNEGRVVELNNQAKHAVANNWDRGRVHLIFDYVDEGFPLTRHTLEKGEAVYQTRRSIDLARHEGSRPSPSFIILGAQKCGTTSLYEYLMTHPLCTKGVQRETHYFDWRWGGRTEEDRKAHGLREDDIEGHSAEYQKYFSAMLKNYPSIMTGESTPSYLLHYDKVIPRLKRLCPWGPKLFCIFRNPVDRAYSQYRMVTSTEGTADQLKARGFSEYGDMTFGDVVDQEIEELIAKGLYRADTPFSSEDFTREIMSSRPMGHGGHSIVARGLYVFQLQPWIEAFPLSDGKLSILSIGDLAHDNVQETMDTVYSKLGLPPHALSQEEVQPKNTREMKEPIDPTVRAKLEKFYAPFNECLFTLIGHRLDNW